MKKVNVGFWIVFLILFALNIAVGQDWQTVYETDFSSDPGWTTNNANTHYWNSSDETYFADQYNINYSGEYAYYDAGYDGGSFKIEFDIIVDNVQYASDLSLGIFDADLSTSTENFVRVAFTNCDQGNVVFMSTTDNLGNNSYVVDNVTQWVIGTWYTVILEYDNNTNNMTANIIERETATPLLALNIAGAGPFDPEMGLLGNSNVRDGSFQVPGAHTSGRFDNVTYALFTSCDDLIQLTFNGGYTGRWSPDGSKIVFTTKRDGYHDIYSMNSDGTGQSRLTFYSGKDALASWHPDGSSLVFVTTRGGTHDIYTMDADGSNIMPFLTYSSWEDGPFWKPDGSKLLFESRMDGGDNDIYTVDADGSNLTRLTFSSAHDGNSQWSSSGDKICFVSYRNGNKQIYTINADGSNEINISNNSYEDDWPTWSPDGQIIFTSNRDGNEEIYVMDSNGSNQTRLTNHPAADRLPHISPDGKWLAFDSERDGTRNIYKMCMPEPIINDISVALDIKPGSCPNPLNIKKPNRKTDMAPANNEVTPSAAKLSSVFPVAILGTADFSVEDIDPSTLMLEGIPIQRWMIEDVGTPMGDDAEECECNTFGPDGFADLTLKFDKGLIIQVVGEANNGDYIPLTLTGELIDGTPIEGSDCVLILGHIYNSKTVFLNELEENSPNPFNPKTNISFVLQQASQTRLEVFNILGEKVSVIVDRYLEAGRHTYEWDGRNIASGIYFYRLQTGDYTETRKMILLK